MVAQQLYEGIEVKGQGTVGLVTYIRTDSVRISQEARADMVKAFGKACGKEIKYVIKDRRPGDIATCYANPEKAKRELGWEAVRGLDEMCEDSWRWQSNNPNGYEA